MMIMTKRCWWCGARYENVDTAVPAGPGWVWDSATSILCTDAASCVRTSTKERARIERSDDR